MNNCNKENYMKKATCFIETVYAHNNEKTIVQRYCDNPEFAFSMLTLLNACKESSENIFDQPYCKVYYLIDKIIDRLLANKQIPEKHGFYFSAMNATLKGESFFTGFLGALKNNEYDDILPNPSSVSLKISYI